MSILGTRVVRTEDPRLLTRGGVYTDDLRLPELDGAARITFVRSPIAHARITGIDTGAALASPGVVAVLTAADMDDIPALGSRPTTEPWLATDRVRYVGEAVAIVLTEQGYQGEDAAELVSVDYDPLPAVVDFDDALAGSTLLFDGTDSNVIRTGGEAAPPGAFDGCEVVVRRTFPNQRLAPLPLEGRAAAARWADGRLTLWASTQNAQLARDALAAAVGLDAAAVRVVAPDVGGGFGAKIAIERDTIIVAWAAKHTGRPVRWVETRNENLLGMVHGRAQRHTITIGGSRDGRILGDQVGEMQLDQHGRGCVGDIALRQHDMLAAADAVAIDEQAPFAERRVMDRRDRDLRDELLGAAAVGDEIGDRADLDRVRLREHDQLAHPRHRAVVVHDLADDAGWAQARDPREVDRGLRMAGADQGAPPRRAFNGNTWPGVAMSCGCVSGLMATAIVRARSAAEMPVVTPVRASIEAVNAVSNLAFCERAIIGRPRCATRSLVSARQMRPRALRAMKLTTSAVANCAGMTRSPSFSRSSSSTRITMRPACASAMISAALDM